MFTNSSEIQKQEVNEIYNTHEVEKELSQKEKNTYRKNIDQ